MEHPEDAMRIAQRFSDAIADRDLAGLESIFAADATIWHNTDGIEQPRDQALAAIAQFLSGVSECHYSAVRRMPTPSGLVQQHDLHVRFGSATTSLVIPVCLIFEIAEGRVRRLDEYLDVSSFSSARTDSS